tara:strand:- start:58 stop:309 length:252 start_codon:yes stop_codon:yes gene_type:complete
MSRVKDKNAAILAMRRWAREQHEPFSIKQMSEHITLRSGKLVKNSLWDKDVSSYYNYLKRSSDYYMVSKNTRYKASTWLWVGL